MLLSMSLVMYRPVLLPTTASIITKPYNTDRILTKKNKNLMISDKIKDFKGNDIIN